ncbi:IncF plasmid conjugative transfer protein TraN [Candidatus Burkholderia pumila]|uniref:IncF plasmid conjugative transfer protein TraN n=1 Tax=Candidatus Burkholderia pumila TaxID=1090375 RepID=A0ABR5HPP0_9BURK|nr:IncF plasmid conjugative transfer protein TraN [Candidatus Burkholderia pumila]
MTSDCQALRDRGCGQVSTRCLSAASDGSCITQKDAFLCKTGPDRQPGGVRQRRILSERRGLFFDTSVPQDKDFGQAVAMLEASREADVYGVSAKVVEIFKGYHETCSIKGVGGATLSNCCSTNDGGQKFINYAMLTVSAGKAIAVGSKYMYDVLHQNIDSTR